MVSVVILAGQNVAGKSSSAPGVITELLAAGAFVNADVIARGLSVAENGRICSQVSTIRSADLTKQRRSRWPSVWFAAILTFWLWFVPPPSREHDARSCHSIR